MSNVKTVKLTGKPSEITGELLEHLKRDRDREVLVKRFGLNGAPKQTLESVGVKFGVTRERVRQIEKAAVDKLKDRASSEIEPVVNKSKEIIQSNGGFIEQHALIHQIVGENKLEQEHNLRFLLELTEKIIKVREDNIVNASYSLKPATSESLKKWTQKLLDTLKEIGKPSTITVIHEALSQKGLSLNEEQVLALMQVNKQVRTTDSLWGLADWREVDPRSIRDKTYIVLKRSGKALHFSEIASEIKLAGFDTRNVTVQAVHNELIKDERFVLIGRGIYALKEWGYAPGTVSEVITEILRKAHKPLHKREIVKKVLENRIVKESTIVLNLQNKNKFKRVAKATYALGK